MSNAWGRRRDHGNAGSTHAIEILHIDRDESPQSSHVTAAAAAGGVVVVGDRSGEEREISSLMHKVGPSLALIGGLAALFYGTVAVAMGFINKAVMMQLPESNFLLLAQMVVTVGVMFLLRSARLVQFAPINAKQAKKLLPVAIL